jgi:Basic region leucine zipper
MTRQYQTSVSSRERNRIHARKTRQRKKEQMHTLTNRADELKCEQIRLKQYINEKNTASILVGLFASDAVAGEQQQVEDPRIEALLRRSSDDIPDAAMLPELPALILPGQHNAKKHKSSGSKSQKAASDDGIDYDLLGKDRSKCTPAELDKIRRERNRMHAKRTRDRKRFFMEEMAEMCQNLEDENKLLQGHLDSLNGKDPIDPAASVISPVLSSAGTPAIAPTHFRMASSTRELEPPPPKNKPTVSPNAVALDQISTLLEAASAFSSAVSDSSSSSQEGSEDSDRDDGRKGKRRRLEEYAAQEAHLNVPNAITTGSTFC